MAEGAASLPKAEVASGRNLGSLICCLYKHFVKLKSYLYSQPNFSASLWAGRRGALLSFPPVGVPPGGRLRQDVSLHTPPLWKFQTAIP